MGVGIVYDYRLQYFKCCENCNTPYNGFLNIINSMYRRVRKCG
nr:MAG TPA: DBF DBF zinc finger [Caudoviricetes sp.]